jgi:two-component system osmolarity sensor histidine kinase EnvZ
MQIAATLGLMARSLSGGIGALARRLGLAPGKRTGSRFLARFLPKGLYGRSLVIVIAPVVLLQSVVAYVFMERHWQLVTRRLSQAVTADVAALIDVYQSYPQDRDAETLTRIAQQRLGLDVAILRDSRLPPPGPRPFFSLLDQALSRQLTIQLQQPFWLDTVGQSDFVEIRVQLDNDVMRVVARRNSAYASNSHIFLAWMVATSTVLLTVAVLFLRNQIRPILALSDAAEAFGKGREVEFRPRGATEVRQAGHAFLEMKRRIERTVSERTTMLNGVSHDLRTILTRFKLSLALMERTPETEALEKDIDEMSRMLEAYLAFARGEAAETPIATDIRGLLEDLKADAERQGHATELTVIGDPVVVVRPDAIRRVLTNLVSNAARHGDQIAITATHDARYLLVTVDDDGPGIPAEMREEVFKPFVRLDEARNVDEGGTGLGLAISRDIARRHGGDIALLDSPTGGLRAMLRLPV